VQQQQQQPLLLPLLLLLSRGVWLVLSWLRFGHKLTAHVQWKLKVQFIFCFSVAFVVLLFTFVFTIEIKNLANGCTYKCQEQTHSHTHTHVEAWIIHTYMECMQYKQINSDSLPNIFGWLAWYEIHTSTHTHTRIQAHTENDWFVGEWRVGAWSMERWERERAKIATMRRLPYC